MALTVHVTEARDLAAADSNGFSDPFVILRLGGQKKKTKTIKKTLDPKWNEQLTLVPKPGDQRLVVHVYDWDLGSSDDFLGELVFDLGSLPLDGAEKWHTLLPRSGKDDKHVKGEILLAFTKAGMSTASTPQKDAGAVVSQIKKRIEAAQASGTEADFSGCELTKIPRVVADTLSAVTALDVGFNKFSSWPEGLDAFKALHTLHLEGNQITSLGGAIGGMPELREFFANGNQIDAFPPELGKCLRLEKINLANNQIGSVPNEIGKLEFLEELDLNGNPLATLPPGIGHCRRLEVMDVSCCNLESVPDQLTHCQSLLELNLGTNDLTALPEASGKLTRLVLLNLSDNKLTDLPLSLGHCHGLSKFGAGCNIERNPIEDQEMVRKFKVGPDHLVDFLEKRMAVKGTPDMRDTKYQYDLPYAPKVDPGAGGAAAAAGAGAGAGAAAAAGAGGAGQTLMQKSIAEQTAKQQAASERADMEEKLNALKRWANNVIQSELRAKLASIQERSNTAVDPATVVQLATMIKQMQPTLAQIKQVIDPFDAPVPDVSSSAPKIDQLKAVVTVSCAEIALCMRGIQIALSKAKESAAIVVLVQHTKQMKAHLDSVC